MSQLLATFANTPYSSPMVTGNWAQELAEGERFEFGSNWQRFLETLSPQQIEAAKQSLRRMLEVQTLEGKRFLDAGCGSGLFSLAAHQLGAEVFSFDFDPNSVACAQYLAAKGRAHTQASATTWHIEQGSVLDQDYLRGVSERYGPFDVVYSWGVLHHTGKMWQACANVAPLVKSGGQLFIAIYNDQGIMSRIWSAVKSTYCKTPHILRWLVLVPAFIMLWGPIVMIDLLRGRPFARWRTYRRERGMTPWRDVVDWVGGYPFEVAKPEEIFSFFRERGFSLTKLTTVRGNHGCCEYVFRKEAV